MCSLTKLWVHDKSKNTQKEEENWSHPDLKDTKPLSDMSEVSDVTWAEAKKIH